jgi:hypothetical protein
VWPGKGWLGECVCGSTFEIDDDQVHDAFGLSKITTTAIRFGVPEDDITGDRRDARLEAARQEIAHDLRLMGWPLHRIAKLLGRRRSAIASMLERWEPGSRAVSSLHPVRLS